MSPLPPTKMEVDERAESMVVDSPPPAAQSHEPMDEELSEHARPRKRTRRACDKCSASRTRCNGECPCRRCEDYGYTCRYNREVKKRGRVPISMTGSNNGAASVHSEPNISHSGRQTTSPRDSRRNSTHNINSSLVGDGQRHFQPTRASFSNGHPSGGTATTPSPSIASPPASLHGGGGGSGATPTLTEPKPSHFAAPQRTHSYGDSPVGPAGRPRLLSTSSSNGLSHGLGQGLHAASLREGLVSTGPVLPGISTVPGPSLPVPSPSSSQHPAYLGSPGGSSTYSASGVHAHMQLASLLDPTSAVDHNPVASTASMQVLHQYQYPQPPGSTLPRIAAQQPQHHQQGKSSSSPPAGAPSSVSGSQPADVPMSDDNSTGYPSPANGGGSVSGGTGPQPPTGPRVSFGGGSGLPGMRPRTYDAAGNGHNTINNNSNSSMSGSARGGHNRASFSTTTTTTTTTGGGLVGEVGSLPELQRVSSLYKAPSSDCRYRCLVPVLPYLGDIIPASVACDLLDVYLTEPGSSLFRCASPYILTRIFRKKSLLHPTNPRPTTPALLATMLWCAAQTADIVLLHVPGSRSKITNALYDLSTSLISDRDPDRWRRIHGGLRVENELQQQQAVNPYSYTHSPGSGSGQQLPETTATNEPAGKVDDVLTFILLSIAVSGGDFKSDCFKWWSKAVRLALALGLNREDERCSASVSPCPNPLCSCRRDQETSSTLAGAEAREERRRVFWLLYCLDRHLALSFNNVLYIPDSYCEVYIPLPEGVWEELDVVTPRDMPERVVGPPIVVSGTGFFEYFLPLMAILGDIIEVHHRRQHPRLGGLDDAHAVALIGEQLTSCERSLDRLAHEVELLEVSGGGSSGNTDYVAPATVAAVTTPSASTAPAVSTPGPHIKDLVTGTVPSMSSATAAHVSPPIPGVPPPVTSSPSMDTTGNGGGGAGADGSSSQHQSPTVPRRCRPSARDRSRLQLVTAYSTHILHVLHVLLHGKWDAISMLDDDDDWITSPRFNDCATRAIAASQAVSRILKHDPELTFMPYLFGIYLLHGSFILLLFADRMPQLGGPNQSVEQACETIVRAHEVCVVTLSTEFQKNFRKVLRSTLYSVRGSSPTEWEEHKARRRALSLYRWTRGAKGLAL